MTPPLGIFSDRKDDSLREKIAFAIRQVEINRRELEQLRSRLDNRRTSIFNLTVRAIERNDEMRARILSGEHVELQKISRVVNASELALLHIIVRLETLRDVGDVMYVLSNAFKAVKRIGKSVSEVAPNLEMMANEINNSFSGILSELGVITPSVSVALSDTPEQIFDKAQELIRERTSELSELPKAMQASTGDGSSESLIERTRKIALLATAEEEDLDGTEFRPVLLRDSEPMRDDAEKAVRKYVQEIKPEKFDLMSCSAQLNLPVDLVEQAYIKLLSEGRFRVESSNRTENDHSLHSV
jgi:division protein CdvB (Snf7/Vps24/ESCRT-III family)